MKTLPAPVITRYTEAGLRHYYEYSDGMEILEYHIKRQPSNVQHIVHSNDVKGFVTISVHIDGIHAGWL